MIQGGDAVSKRSEALSKRTRTRLKTDPTEYIANQVVMDERVRNVLQLMQNIVNEYEKKYKEKVLNKIYLVNEKLQEIDYRHRAYSQINTLNGIFYSYAKLIEEKYEQSLQIIDEQINSQYEIQNKLKPQLLALSYLLKLLILEIMMKSTDQKHFKQQIMYAMLTLKRIKITKNDLDLFSMLWESKILSEVIVCLYQLVIGQILELGVRYGRKLFEQGIRISKKLLGEKHKITITLKNISSLRKQTRKLLKLSDSESLYSGKKKKGRGKQKNHTKSIEQITSTLKLQVNRKNKHFIITPHSVVKHKMLPLQSKKKVTNEKIDAPEMKNLRSIKQLYKPEELAKKIKESQQVKQELLKDKLRRYQQFQKKRPLQIVRKNGFIVNQGSLINTSKLGQMIQRSEKQEQKKNHDQLNQNFNSKKHHQSTYQDEIVQEVSKEKDDSFNCQLI